MTDRNITISQYLLKELGDSMRSLYKLISEGEVVVANLKGTWDALSVTHENWERDIMEDKVRREEEER